MPPRPSPGPPAGHPPPDPLALVKDAVHLRVVARERRAVDARLERARGVADFLAKPIDWGRLKRILDHLRRSEEHGGDGPVLVVEDDEGTRELLRDMLEREGWPVTTAANGREGLERMAETRPVVVLLDLMMPEMNGFAVAQAMRREPAWADIPVIVVTAKDVTAEDRQRLRGNVRQIIPKGRQAAAGDMVAEVRRAVAAAAPVEAAPAAEKTATRTDA